MRRFLPPRRRVPLPRELIARLQYLPWNAGTFTSDLPTSYHVRERGGANSLGRRQCYDNASYCRHRRTVLELTAMAVGSSVLRMNGSNLPSAAIGDNAACGAGSGAGEGSSSNARVGPLSEQAEPDAAFRTERTFW
jgi:hypothetical protein